MADNLLQFSDLLIPHGNFLEAGSEGQFFPDFFTCYKAGSCKTLILLCKQKYKKFREVYFNPSRLVTAEFIDYCCCVVYLSIANEEEDGLGIDLICQPKNLSSN